MIWESDGTTTTHYVLGEGQLLGQTRNGVTHYYLPDAQGSTRALTSTSGAVTDTYSYSAFGGLLNRTGTTENAYLYTGQQYDDLTELYSLRARYMNPAVGRFVSRDTWAYDFANPVELNRYVYAMGNPVNYVDPSGYVAAKNYRAANQPALVVLNTAKKIIQFPGGWHYSREQIVRLVRLTALPLAVPLFDIFGHVLELLLAPGGGQSTTPPISSNPIGEDVRSPDQSVLPVPVKPPQKDEKDDDCPTTSYPIVWPIPIWIGLGFGDSGATSGMNDYPETKLLKKVPSPMRDERVIGRYVSKNIEKLRPYFQSDMKPREKVAWSRGNIHHKIPLFLGGKDTENNLVYLPVNIHAEWHNKLNRQGKFGAMTRDPIGTEYCVVNIK